jgi:hypothetical protein
VCVKVEPLCIYLRSCVIHEASYLTDFFTYGPYILLCCERKLDGSVTMLLRQLDSLLLSIHCLDVLFNY